MKLIRFGNAGEEKPGVLINEQRYDVSDAVGDYDEQFFASGGIEKLRDHITKNHNDLHPVANDTRLGPPVARPSKIVCAGLNYVDHAKETNANIPTEPILFLKSTSAIVGPNDDLIIPRNSGKTDWEVELALVIGKKASYVAESEANAYIAGYLLHNDYSERAYQLERGGQWTKGKGCDTFAPLGPYLVLPEEIPDVNRLRLWLTVNGKTMQDGNTSNLVFNISYLIHYISQFMTLLPGDIISTGTPAGVALGRKEDGVYLKPGDEVSLGVDGLGVATQKARAYH